MVNIARLTIWSIYCSRGGGEGRADPLIVAPFIGASLEVLYSHCTSIATATRVLACGEHKAFYKEDCCSDVDIFPSLLNVRMG